MYNKFIASAILDQDMGGLVICWLLLQIPGLVNVDFADVRAIMANAGSSLMGIGTATGIKKPVGCC